MLTWGEHNDAYISGVTIEGNQVLDNESGIMLHRSLNSQVLNNTIRNAGNQGNMAYPMTLHIFEGASGNTVLGNTHIGGKTVDAGSGNTVSDAATKAGVYVRGSARVGETVYADLLDTDGIASGVSYQWYADGGAIPGATSATYQLMPGDANKTITVTSSFTDSSGNEERPTSEGTVVADR